jgi:hypothetical protein
MTGWVSGQAPTIAVNQATRARRRNGRRGEVGVRQHQLVAVAHPRERVQ